MPQESVEAARWFLKAAEQGNANAQWRLSSCYAYGSGVERDYNQSLKWLRLAADQGQPEATFELGFRYLYGQGVAQDTPKGLKFIRQAAEQGLVAAQTMLGDALESGLLNGQLPIAVNVAESFKWYRAAAENGDSDAQNSLGLCYWNGQGTAKDPKEAVRWLRKSAEQGNTEAFSNLGLLYRSGDGVPKDFTEAAKWYRKAAEQGFAAAQDHLGAIYANGQGVVKDPAEAVKWYRKAADQGHAGAQFNLGVKYASGEGVPKDNREAAMWFRKAADQGSGLAQYRLGLMYARGDGVLKDSAEAVKLYRKAAAQGFSAAQDNLGAMYANGEGVPRDTIEALAWFNISAAAGSAQAVQNRGKFEDFLGRDAALVAQQRSREILKEIEAAKVRRSAAASEKATPKSSGSGAIVSAQGLLLTAAHVVVGASRLSVVTAQGIREATVLCADEANDVAILKIAGGTYSPLPVAPSRQVRLGQSVATIGFPNIGFQGFSPKVTRGEISSVNGYADDPRCWQISVPVQPGNSGGPLLDDNGNLIGIVISKLGLKAVQATGDIPQNVNYAVKSTYALALLEPYLDNNAPEPRQTSTSFEDMVAQAQSSVVLVLTY